MIINILTVVGRYSYEQSEYYATANRSWKSSNWVENITVGIFYQLERPSQ
jgi:hypothetical protein